MANSKKASEEKKPQTWNVSELDRTRDNVFESYYANTARLSFTPHDINIVFGNVDLQPGKKRPVVVEIAKVSMGPFEALAVANLIIKQFVEWREMHFEKLQEAAKSVSSEKADDPLSAASQGGD